MKENKIRESFVIRDLETLKVIADPLRTQIFEVLIHEPQTIKQVAEKIGLAPSKLYYHVNLLEKHGLIQVVETHLLANLVEKVYRTVAPDLEIDPELLSFSTQEGQENIHSLIATTIDVTREDLQRSLQARAFNLERGAKEQPRRAMITRMTAQIPEERAQEFAGRLEELIHEFGEADGKMQSEGEEMQDYALMVAFYPTFYFDLPEEELGSE